MLSEISAEKLAERVTEDVYERALHLSGALGARIGKPRSPPIAKQVTTVVKYAQGGGAELSNDQILGATNSVLLTLSGTCYPPATPVARAIFDRKAGEAQTEIELALLAARARWDIEIGMEVPIRWLAALGGVAVKTARNVASAGHLSTQTNHAGQVATAKEAARWLETRGISINVGSRRVNTAKPPRDAGRRSAG